MNNFHNVYNIVRIENKKNSFAIRTRASMGYMLPQVLYIANAKYLFILARDVFVTISSFSRLPSKRRSSIVAFMLDTEPGQSLLIL